MIFYYTLVHALPFVRHPFWGSHLGALTAVKYLGVICVICALVAVLAQGSLPRFFDTMAVRLFIGLAGLALLSYVTQGVSPWAQNPILVYASHGANCFATLVLINNTRRLQTAVLVAVGSVGLMSAYAIKEWMEGSRLWAGYRPGWVAGDANALSGTVLLVVPLAYCLMLSLPGWKRILCMGSLAISLVAFLLAASRGGLLGLIVAYLVVSWRSRRRVASLVLAGIVVIGMQVAFGASLRRLLHPTEADRQSTESRKLLWRTAGRMIKDNSVVGVGIGNFSAALQDYLDPEEKTRFHVAHNTYLGVAAEMGVPALVLFIGVVLSPILLLGRLSRQGRKVQAACRTMGRAAPEALQAQAKRLEELMPIIVGAQAGLAGFSICLMTFSGEHLKMFWFMVFISACIKSLACEEPAGAAHPVSMQVPAYARR